MRTALSALLGLALTTPVFAQSKPVPPPPNEETARQLKELTARLRELEAKLKSADGKKEGEQKVEVRVIEAKDGTAKVEPKTEGGVMVLRVQKDGEKKDEPRRPDGLPMGGGFGGSFGGGPGGPGGNPFNQIRPDFTPPGFDKLSKDEQEQFRKLTAKMRGGDQRMEVRVREVRREGEERGERRETETRRPEGGERRPNLEERMERMERAIEEIRRAMKK